MSGLMRKDLGLIPMVRDPKDVCIGARPSEEGFFDSSKYNSKYIDISKRGPSLDFEVYRYLKTGPVPAKIR